MVVIIINHKKKINVAFFVSGKAFLLFCNVYRRDFNSSVKY